MTPRALVLRAAGTNCDRETVSALSAAGAGPELLHLRELLARPGRLESYRLLVIPGGFSYGDDVAAGRILANELRFKLGSELAGFVAKGRLVIGVCNGFQALVKAGFLPGEGQGPAQTASLTDNDSGRFQCEWTGIRREDSRAEWLSGLPRSFELPIAHGEGRFVARDAGHLRSLFRKGQVVFRYHPKNPNGSQGSIAGICNEGGNVVGLMPHPERYVNAFQHPAWTSIKSRHTTGGQAPGHLFWKSAADYAKGLS